MNGTLQYSSLAAELGILGVIQGEELRAKCPLHRDRNPSFSLNVNTGLWICFGCHEKGSFTELVEKVLSVGIGEAYEWVVSNGKRTTVDQLSKNLAIELGQYPGQPPTKQEMGWRTYWSSLDNKVVPLWFLKRGFTWDTINHWGIRADPVQDAIVIPVNWEGELVGIISRPLNGKPKYQNSPNLPRAEILFGEISRNQNAIILCEGPLDAIWLWQNKFNAAALLGSDLTQGQVNILRKHRYGEIVLALDSDSAGTKGIASAANMLVNAGWLLPQLTIMFYPEGKKDPGECTQDELVDAYENRRDLL